MKEFLKRHLPESQIEVLKKIYRPIKRLRSYLYVKYWMFVAHHVRSRILKKVRRKEVVDIAFFVVHRSVWKLDLVFQMLLKDPRYNPYIVVCPYVVYGDEQMDFDMEATYTYFKELGYPLVSSLDKDTGSWLDVKRELRPDVVFFTNPYVGLTRNEYTILNFKTQLTCYVGYGFGVDIVGMSVYKSYMKSFVWKHFVESEFHSRLACKLSYSKITNVVITGYPGIDVFLLGRIQHDPWKHPSKERKKIIWAPHHTIEGYGATLDYSTFMKYHDFMLEMAQKYSDQIQFAFKPHPILRPKLSLPAVWGKRKTDEYYCRWETLENGQLEEGEYVDLFLTSDAMIHDSGSFILEYVFTKKPVMYLHRDMAVGDRLNELGKEALSKFYKGFDENDIVRFIEDVVIGDNDSMLREREIFLKERLLPPHGKLASENIYEYMNKVLI